MLVTMSLIRSASAAYQSVLRGDGRRLMQSIAADYIECLTAGGKRPPVPGPFVCPRRQQPQPLWALNWIARDAISDAVRWHSAQTVQSLLQQQLVCCSSVAICH